MEKYPYKCVTCSTPIDVVKGNDDVYVCVSAYDDTEMENKKLKAQLLKAMEALKCYSGVSVWTNEDGEVYVADITIEEIRRGK